MELKVIVERNIPFIKGALESVADVCYLPADEISRGVLADADALITRTRTRCDAALLDGTRCRFIATATIGTDHIDLRYCAENGITVANAPGCNAPAVAQWVLSSAVRLMDGEPREKVLGIVGVGHVGSIVDRWARSIGFTTLLCDPPRAEREGAAGFVEIDEVASRADIITFHTPLTVDGPCPTYHIADDTFFRNCLRSPIVMNAARGAVVDTDALIRALESGQVSHVAVDCWEGEPAISPRLLSLAAVATPHIAGYSLEGKIRATQMALDALSAHFGLPRLLAKANPAPAPKAAVTVREVLESYDPMVDTGHLKASPGGFEALRNNYDYRPEP